MQQFAEAHERNRRHFCPLEALDDSLKVRWRVSWAGRKQTSASFASCAARLMPAKKRRLGYRMRVEIARAGESVVPFPSRSQRPSWPVAVKIPRVVIVGSGPAGAWAALRLAELV